MRCIDPVFFDDADLAGKILQEVSFRTELGTVFHRKTPQDLRLFFVGEDVCGRQTKGVAEDAKKDAVKGAEGYVGPAGRRLLQKPFPHFLRRGARKSHHQDIGW